MTNYAQGHEAEKRAAAYLRKQGYKVMELNWKRPRAEIDIIARRRRGPLMFVEVKYREHADQGSGLDYITPRKLEQMRFAAELWVAEYRYDGEYVLAAIELSDQDFTVSQFIEELS